LRQQLIIEVGRQVLVSVAWIADLLLALLNARTNTGDTRNALLLQAIGLVRYPNYETRVAFNSCTRVLIVEDDAVVASMMEGIVEDIGHQIVGPAFDFKSALRLANIDEVDFALLDFDPGGGLNAAPIANTLAQRGIPFAFTTGRCSAIIRTLFADTPIVSKPVDDDELLDLLPCMA
jgi:CheY-like chemotaxis protein